LRADVVVIAGVAVVEVAIDASSLVVVARVQGAVVVIVATQIFFRAPALHVADLDAAYVPVVFTHHGLLCRAFSFGAEVAERTRVAVIAGHVYRVIDAGEGEARRAAGRGIAAIVCAVVYVVTGTGCALAIPVLQTAVFAGARVVIITSAPEVDRKVIRAGVGAAYEAIISGSAGLSVVVTCVSDPAIAFLQAVRARAITRAGGFEAAMVALAFVRGSSAFSVFVTYIRLGAGIFVVTSRTHFAAHGFLRVVG